MENEEKVQTKKKKRFNEVWTKKEESIRKSQKERKRAKQKTKHEIKKG